MAVYHCISRTVNGDFLLDLGAREFLRKDFWRVADYCGVVILTHAILSNHFHILVRVLQKGPVSDAELLRRYAVLYPKLSRYNAARLEVIKKQLAINGPEAVRWREGQLAQMGDISSFMKLVKQRFTTWFNETHNRFGTLWAERFKSILVEPGETLRKVASYIDLNCVRAGLAQDPKDYRFCGYAEAVAGNPEAQHGLISILGGSWDQTQEGYRQILFGSGVDCIPKEDLERVLREGGQLPITVLLRCRIRYFTDGGVIGSRAFVTEQLARYCKLTGRRAKRGPRELLPVTDWGDMTVMRGLRQSVFE